MGSGGSQARGRGGGRRREGRGREDTAPQPPSALRVLACPLCLGEPPASGDGGGGQGSGPALPGAGGPEDQPGTEAPQPARLPDERPEEQAGSPPPPGSAGAQGPPAGRTCLCCSRRTDQDGWPGRRGTQSPSSAAAPGPGALLLPLLPAGQAPLGSSGVSARKQPTGLPDRPAALGGSQVPAAAEEPWGRGPRGQEGTGRTLEGISLPPPCGSRPRSPSPARSERHLLLFYQLSLRGESPIPELMVLALTCFNRPRAPINHLLVALLISAPANALEWQPAESRRCR